MLLSIILGRSCLERQGYLRRHLVQSQMMALLWRQRLSAVLKSLSATEPSDFGDNARNIH